MRDPATQGILNASAALLQAGAPQVGRPTRLGGNLGMALQAYNQAYGKADAAELERKRQAELDKINNRYKSAQAAQMEMTAQRAKNEIYEPLAGGAFVRITDPTTGESEIKRQDEVADEILKQKEAGKKDNTVVMSDKLAEQQAEDLDSIRTVQDINESVDEFLDMIDEGELVFGYGANLADSTVGRFVNDGGSKFTRNRDAFKRFMTRLRNELLRIAKGVQTDGDAERALAELIQPEETLSTPAVEAALLDLRQTNLKTIARLKQKVQDLRSAKQMKPYDFGSNTVMGVGVGGE